MPTTRIYSASNQTATLKKLVQLAQKASVHHDIIRAARQIVSVCDSRNDDCELEAIFDAVKNGTPMVRGLERGLKYISDPRYADHFTAPARLLEMCRDGACGADCDDHAMFVAALCGALGFRSGLRAYARPDERLYSHVYAVVVYPKRPPFESVVPMDTTVPTATVGWQPKRGRVLTALFE